MTNLIVFLIITIIVLLIVRAFWLWYWRVNVAIDKLDKIEKYLELIATNTSKPKTTPQQQVVVTQETVAPPTSRSLNIKA